MVEEEEKTGVEKSLNTFSSDEESGFMDKYFLPQEKDVQLPQINNGTSLIT